MDIADIKTEFGLYYKKSGQNASRIFSQLRAKTPTTEVFTPIVTDDTIWQAGKATMTRVLQPFQKAFTPIDPLTITPAEIRMFKMKVDISEYPDDLEASWLGFLAGDEVTRKDWPFVKWYLEQHIIPQAKEDEELLEIFNGVYAAPTPGTAGAAGTSMDGINKIILDGIAANRIVPITTGAFNSDPELFVTQIEGFADDINTKYWGIKMQLNMSETRARHFFRGYQKKYGKDTNYKDGKGEVPFTNLTVNGLPSMAASDGIFCTPKSNAVRLLKKTENMDKFAIENVDRQVKLYSDWWTAVGFIIPEIVFVNELFEEPGS
ncbi:MAG: hypothetical protein V4608_03310 [Bacteroidota bacterium]